MATKLYVIANATSHNTQLLNTERSQDNTVLNANSVVHTGGQDNDYCDIPACSGEQYFSAHHMQVYGSGIDIAFWRDDSKGNELFYSLHNNFNSKIGIEGSNSWDGTTMLIQITDGKLHVNFFSY